MLCSMCALSHQRALLILSQTFLANTLLLFFCIIDLVLMMNIPIQIKMRKKCFRILSRLISFIFSQKVLLPSVHLTFPFTFFFFALSFCCNGLTFGLRSPFPVPLTCHLYALSKLIKSGRLSCIFNQNDWQQAMNYKSILDIISHWKSFLYHFRIFALTILSI